MRVIIAGGTGLIGRKLAASLAADSHEVFVLSRQPEAVRGLPSGVHAVGWDARTPQEWGHLVDGADAVVNLAGESIAGKGFIPARWTESRKQRILQSRLDAAHAIVEAVDAAANKPKVVLQASAVGYYGPCGDELIAESHPAGNDFLASVCVQWENASARVEAMGVRRVVARIGLVLTPDEGVLPKLVLPFRFFVGGALGTGSQWYPWLHIDDLTSALRFLITREGASGSFNLTAPNPLTTRDFSRVLGRVLHRPSWLPVPSFVLRLVLGEISALVLEGQRAVPQNLSDAGFTFQFPELEAALRNLLAPGVASYLDSADMITLQGKG